MTANSKQIQYNQAEMDYFAYPKGLQKDILTIRNQYSKLRETNLRNLWKNHRAESFEQILPVVFLISNLLNAALSSPLIINENFSSDLIVPIPMVYACFGTCSFDSKNVDLLESFSLIRKHSVFVLQKLQLAH